MLARYTAVWVLKSESFFPPFVQNVFCKMESFFLFSKKKIFFSFRLELTLQSVNSKQLEKREGRRGKILVRESESEWRIAWNGFSVCVWWVGGCKWGGMVWLLHFWEKKVHSTSSESFRFSLACLWLYLCLWYDAYARHLLLRIIFIFCVFTIETFILLMLNYYIRDDSRYSNTSFDSDWV